MIRLRTRSLLSVGLFLCGLLLLQTIGAGASPRVLDVGKQPRDGRLGPARTLNDAYHPWVPPDSREAWENQREQLREQLLVSEGLWPMPDMAPLKPVVHGKIERDEYTIEKVFVASLPGHYVSGNLYRPKNVTGKVPGVLFAHGHWENGRLYELSDDKAKVQQLDKGAEKFLAGAKFPLQALPVQLARMGCTVFVWDTVGVADSKKLSHTEAFKDIGASLRLQSSMGLQTINSTRALDFLLSLPEVDPARIGMTGASGGGTQTFILSALDRRITANFPAVMVSTAMQGGCVCENCSYLRIGTNNVAFAAMFAPRPMALSGANDWTIDIETKGLPELKQIYGLYLKPELVHAKTYPQFDHNYNQVSRELMYAWFNQHLKLGLAEPIEERDFTPVPPAELSVYDAEHPVPGDAADAAGLKDYLTRNSDDQFAALLPKDPAGVPKYRSVVGAAARVMLDRGLPSPDEVVDVSPLAQADKDGYRLYRLSVTRRGAGEEVPIVGMIPTAGFNGTAVLWFDGAGKKHLFGDDGKPSAAVSKLFAKGFAVISADIYQTGEFLADESQPAAPRVDKNFAAYTFGYNRPLLSQRVHDVLTVIAAVKRYPDFCAIKVVGTGDAGLWTLLARPFAGNAIQSCSADLSGFGFGAVTSFDDPRMLPGGLKYGGVGGLISWGAPAPISLYGTAGTPEAELKALTAVYAAAKGTLKQVPTPLTDEEVVKELTK